MDTENGDVCWNAWLKDNFPEPDIIPVSEEFVETGKWENPYGEVVEFPGSQQYLIRYYGTCPCCKKEICVDNVIGSYADPVYPRYCAECGAENNP